MEEILSLLCSHVKLERDKGIQQLEETLKDSKNLVVDVIKLEELKNSLITLVQSTNRGWEAKHGGLTGSKSLILNKLDSDDFCETLRKEALRLMHDDEARVRTASGNFICRVNPSVNRSDQLRACFSKVPRTFRVWKASCQNTIRLFSKADLLT